MNPTIRHGKIAVAVIAMLTLSALLIQCTFVPSCEQVRTEVIVVLLAVIGSMLGVDILGEATGGDGSE